VTAARIGAARQLVSLQSKVLTPDGGGGYSEAWETYATVWAAFSFGSGRQSSEAGRSESRVPVRVTIRKRGDVSPNHHIFFRGRIFAIRAIEDEGPQALWITLVCEEGAPS
jgi:SPP1 family predicted phage head-tail adaptor